MLGSLFRPLGILYVRITFHYRTTLCRLQNLLSYGFLLCIQLCCCLLFIVHEYGEFNSYILYSCHPLKALFRRFNTLIITLVTLVYIALPLRDRKVISLYNKLPIKYFCINFCLRLTHRLADLCYSLTSIITVGTRTFRLNCFPYNGS